MQSIKSSLIMLAAALLATSALAEQPLSVVGHPEELGFSAERLERLGKQMQTYIDSGQLPGVVVLVARKDKIAYEKAFGFRDREQKVAMTADSIFRLASMTKPIVSVGAMMLAEEGKLDIAAPVSQYLPEFKDLKVRTEKVDPATGKVEVTMEPQARPMIVQDLLRHTAGLVYPPPIGRGPVPELYKQANVSARSDTLADTVTKLSKLPLAYQPGEVWEYSMAVDVLGRVIEVASGMELDRYIEERITKPLGMSSTGFYVRDADAARVAQPQVDPATGQRPPLFDAAVKPKGFSGGGGMVSTIADYLRFSEMLLHGGILGNVRLLSPTTVSLMTSSALKPGIGYGSVIPRFSDIGPTPDQGQGFGLGFAVRTETGENPLPGSVGSFYWTGAYGTNFYADPRQQMVIIMMIQSYGPNSNNNAYRHAFRYLAYGALTAPN